MKLQALIQFAKRPKIRKFLKGLLILIVVGGDVAFYSPSGQVFQSKQLSSQMSADQQKTQSGICNTATCDNQRGRIGSWLSINASLSLEARVSIYENSNAVSDLIDQAKKLNRTRHGLRAKSTGYCLRFVKKALQKVGLTSGYLSAPVAKTSGKSFKAAGFTNLLETSYASHIHSPYDAPVGAVLIYSGGDYGHSEIKTEDGFISDFFNKRARTGDERSGMSGRNRKLIGVYVKLDLEKDRS